jgi:hypothetical protein
MKKLLVGCLVVAVFAGVLLAVGGYLLYRAAAPVLEDARSFVQGLADVSEIEKAIANQSAFAAPASGELSGAQVERFARVQESVRTSMGHRMGEIEEKYKHLRARADEQRDASFADVVGALREVSGLFAQARRYQVEAMNRENFSSGEYRWVRDRVFQAAGIEIANLVDWKQLEDAARRNTGLERLEAPALPKIDVPEANRVLVKPFVARMERWLPLVFFGL